MTRVHPGSEMPMAGHSRVLAEEDQLGARRLPLPCHALAADAGTLDPLAVGRILRAPRHEETGAERASRSHCLAQPRIEPGRRLDTRGDADRLPDAYFQLPADLQPRNGSSDRRRAYELLYPDIRFLEERGRGARIARLPCSIEFNRAGGRYRLGPCKEGNLRVPCELEGFPGRRSSPVEQADAAVGMACGVQERAYQSGATEWRGGIDGTDIRPGFIKTGVDGGR